MHVASGRKGYGITRPETAQGPQNRPQSTIFLAPSNVACPPELFEFHARIHWQG